MRDFVGPDGTAQQLSFLDPGYIDTRDNIPCIGSMKEYVEIMRRIAIPNYEEARRYWAQAEADGVFDGANEVSPYTQRTLTYILAEYRPENELDKL